ncbi:MAG: sensor histidine kinase [Rubrivivax sp.]
MRFDPPTFFLACGTLYGALPLMVWVVLHRRHPAMAVNLWCLGGLLFAGTLALYGLRGQVDDLFSVWLANTLSYVAGCLQLGVLRHEGGRRPWALLLALYAALASGLTYAAEAMGTIDRQGVVNGLQGLLALYLATAAWRLARERRSRSAGAMALLFLLMGLALMARCVGYLSGLISTPAFRPDPLFLVAVFLTLFAAIAGNLGFVGMALDRARATAREQQAALLALRDQQQAMDAAAQTRRAVAGERERTTQLLAHEVRQPLHNAGVALQAALSTLARSREPAEAARAVEQAQAVIRRVSATLDNTVAATALLTGSARISTADTDLQVLIDLSLADLAPEARPRVHVDYRADARSARLEPTLVRLALRNLLANATLYAPAGTTVQLRVLDSDDPLALVIEVADLGPGIPDDLRERIFDEGVRGQQATVPGYGLGLHVVQQVARLHGGRIEWRANTPHGSVFRLTLPQSDPG